MRGLQVLETELRLYKNYCRGDVSRGAWRGSLNDKKMCCKIVQGEKGGGWEARYCVYSVSNRHTSFKNACTCMYVVGMPVAPNVAEDKTESAFLQDALFGSRNAWFGLFWLPSAMMSAAQSKGRSQGSMSQQTRV